ncbi:MAG: PAS domain S-box protein [Rhodopila sp.]
MADHIAQSRTDRTRLHQIIAELPEGIIIINLDQTIAWANDAALAIHGIKSRKDLGRTVLDYRARFELRYRDGQQLTPDEYPMARVVGGESFSEVIVEVHQHKGKRLGIQRLRGLVINNSDGQPDCLALIIDDETDRFDAEDRFERAFSANPAPAIIARLSDMRYVKVNQGFLELTGHLQETLIGRSVHEFDVLEGALQRDLAIERLHSGMTIPQMEGLLRVATGASRTVIVAGQPIEIGDEACMLFTFADLHPRKQAEDALRQSEQRFAAAFRLAPCPMAMIALDGLRLLNVNDAFTAATGWRREEVVGRTEPELGLWGHGPTRDDVVRLIRQTGQLRSTDIRCKAKGGRISDYLLSAETVTIHGEHCVLTVMLDITDRKQTEAELQAAIEAVMQDTSWFGQKVVEKLASLTGHGAPESPESNVGELTPRAREVLELVAQGRSDDEIARKFGVSRNTIRNHVSAIYRTTGVRKRSALVVWARERGLGIREKAKVEQKPAKVR